MVIICLNIISPTKSALLAAIVMLLEESMCAPSLTPGGQTNEQQDSLPLPRVPKIAVIANWKMQLLGLKQEILYCV